MQDVGETHSVDDLCVYVVCEVMWIRSAWGWITDVIACKGCEMQDVGERMSESRNETQIERMKS